jgi:hypothetical protein
MLLEEGFSDLPNFFRISPLSLPSWWLWDSLLKPDLWKFGSALFFFRVDEFAGLDSERMNE